MLKNIAYLATTLVLLGFASTKAMDLDDMAYYLKDNDDDNFKGKEGVVKSLKLASATSGTCGVGALPAGFKAESALVEQTYASISKDLWESGSNCSKCLLVKCTGKKCKDDEKEQIVFVADQCTDCKKNDIRVAGPALMQLTGSDSVEDEFQVEWDFVNCPNRNNQKRKKKKKSIFLKFLKWRKNKKRGG